MEILFLPMMVGLLASSVAYGVAYARTQDRHAAGFTVSRYTHWYSPYLLLILWPVSGLELGHDGTQFIQFQNAAQDAFYGVCAGGMLGYLTMLFAQWVGRRYPGNRLQAQSTSLGMIGLLLIAPIVEEILFRGYGYELSSPIGIVAGAIITSAAFALWHMNPYLTAPSFIFGLVASALYLYTHSLLAPIIAHGISNLAYWRWLGGGRRK